jgi:ankyrin repeat protein
MLPIHWAAADGRIDSIEFLLSRCNVDMNIQDGNGSSAAVIAAQYNQIDTVIYLYKHGADLTLPDTNGDHCLHWSAYKGNEELLSLLLYLCPRELNTTDRYGQAALHLAAIKGHYELVDILMNKYRADWTLRDKSNKTPLELAIEKKQLKVEWLLRKLTTTNSFELYRKVLFGDWK